MEAFVLCIIINLMILVIISIKEKENLWKNITAFCQDWWDNYRLPSMWAVIGLVILAIFGFAIFG